MENLAEFDELAASFVKAGKLTAAEVKRIRCRPEMAIAGEIDPVTGELTISSEVMGAVNEEET